VHSRKSTHGGHKAPPDRHYFDDVAHALEGAHEILLIGPAQTKREFATFLQNKHPQMRSAVVAVEDADHPTDPEVLAYARRHFKAIDRMFAPNA
jgi:stalled ribosome rescue protein Dom34